MKRKHLTKTPLCPRECLVIISYTTGLSFALERIGPLAPIIVIVFYLLVLYLLALPNTPWYVSNVSIIFDAPCLFLHHLLSVSLHFVALLCIFGTNLLTSRHRASSLFFAIFVLQKSYTGNILRIGRNQSQSPRISPKLPENRRGDGVGPRGPHTIGRRGPGPGHAPYVWGHLGPLLTMPLRL
jgi:hypothetical protein